MQTAETNRQALRQAAQDIALVKAQLQAAGVILASIAFAIGDSLASEAERAKAQRQAARQPPGKAP